MKRAITIPTLREDEYVTVCKNCTCVYTYYKEDIEMHYPDVDSTNPITLLTYVTCPVCKHPEVLK